MVLVSPQCTECYISQSQTADRFLKTFSGLKTYFLLLQLSKPRVFQDRLDFSKQEKITSFRLGE